MGEGAIGIALWKLQESLADEIYATVFEKHDKLVHLFERFGFAYKGKNPRGEAVYVKSRKAIYYSSPYKAFPFIRSDFTKAGLIPIYESYHDRLFPFSELMRNKKEIEEITEGNGITKIYIGTPWTTMSYEAGEPVLIYRIFEGEKVKLINQQLHRLQQS